MRLLLFLSLFSLAVVRPPITFIVEQNDVAAYDSKLSTFKINKMAVLSCFWIKVSKYFLQLWRVCEKKRDENAHFRDIFFFFFFWKDFLCDVFYDTSMMDGWIWSSYWIFHWFKSVRCQKRSCWCHIFSFFFWKPDLTNQSCTLTWTTLQKLN